MKIIFHEKFYDWDYASNGASASGRMESIIGELEKEYKIIPPKPAYPADVRIAHSEEYIRKIATDQNLYNMALLSVGGAILASEIAFTGEPAFACIRPPGHHAYRESGWGYCVFSNIGITLLKLIDEGLINSAFILDFDAHTGDGSRDVLSDWDEAKILNPMAENRKDYIRTIEDYLKDIDHVDIVAVSAGFDTYEKDCGKKLKTGDFYTIGWFMRKLAERVCHGRRFAILEGGYYQQDLGKNVFSFCHGFE